MNKSLDGKPSKPISLLTVVISGRKRINIYKQQGVLIKMYTKKHKENYEAEPEDRKWKKETKLHGAMQQLRRCERNFQKANLVWLGWLKVDSIL